MSQIVAPRRKLPRKVHQVRAQIAYWQGVLAGCQEAESAAPHTPWAEQEVQAYYARTRGY